MTGQANGSTLYINMVNHNDNNHFATGNFVMVYHTNAQTQFDKSLPGASIGYSQVRDVIGGVNMDSSSNSQQSIPDADHNHKNDGKKNNDIPFTLPFP
jgi:hypothetical protein